MKKLLLIIAVIAVAYIGLTQNSSLSPGKVAETSNGSDQVIASAFENHRSNLRIEGQGIVSKILSDDVEGNRHQRFIIRLDSGRTLLVAHNIDLAPRVASLREGDKVMFNGEYEWSPKGGVIHWTHRDPSGRHATGWIKHGGQTYQ